VLGLFNDYDDATRELMHSLETAGVPLTPVVINYGGELPDGALCPFVVYTGLELRGEPLFFNEVPIPPWCEIRQGSEVYGEVLRDDEVIGRINYEANTFRQVESVDWLLRDGSVGHTDRYDRYGNRYAVRLLRRRCRASDRLPRAGGVDDRGRPCRAIGRHAIGRAPAHVPEPHGFRLALRRRAGARRR
jgi:hypothetical protein